jgi:hypothetical protein
MNVNPWPMMIGDMRGMTVIQDQTIKKREDEGRVVRSRATTISLNSQMVNHQETHKFIHDEIYYKM